MRVAVITLPLHTNYGGILQAYALKKSIESLGHTADIIDRRCKMVLPPSWKMPLIYLKRMVLNLKPGGKGPEIFREKRILREFPYVSSELAPFVACEIAPRTVDDYHSDIGLGEYDAFVAGSDQIWRPKYFGNIEDAFLAFTSGWNVKRIAYAASFGTDQLEYSYTQLEECSALLKNFDAVSVREASAVTICDEWFDREDALHVLDPVMLLPPEHYRTIAGQSSSRPCRGKVLSYILDPDHSKLSVLGRLTGWLGIDSYDACIPDRNRDIPLKDRVVPSMPQWLSCFADAEFVVTDSFHGCVLAILLHKPFIALGNVSRGMSRIQSLLESFGLEDRIVQGIDPDDDGEYFLSGIDWTEADARLEAMREKSIGFLRAALK
ncbi:MAG: polysaccharide pyruvyl transferase family protein [Bacteroidales bacterium]|nr:polysaccharide pyruvyl transferase family protein [Bacteroidales bacterium]